MTVPKIFATGATGYIGGSVLDLLITTHPDWQYTLLVRNSDKGAKVGARWASVRLVYGDWESAEEVLEREAEAADVVLHLADADSSSAITALITGLSRKASPGHLIHTSGTGILVFQDTDKSTYGHASTQIWSDTDSLAQITSIPVHALHRPVDQIVLDAAASGKVLTAIVCPPTIYGTGTGPDNKRSVQIPRLAAAFLARGKGFCVGEGLAKWTHVHISDLSRLYLMLTEAAAGLVVSGGSDSAPNVGKATWGVEGYYFCEAGEHEWGEVARQMAKKAKAMGLLETDEVDSVSAEHASEFGRDAAPILWGTNSRCKAKRARELMGWEASGPKLEDCLEEALEVERKRRGGGHAKVAAGDA